MTKSGWVTGRRDIYLCFLTLENCPTLETILKGNLAHLLGISQLLGLFVCICSKLVNHLLLQELLFPWFFWLCLILILLSYCQTIFIFFMVSSSSGYPICLSLHNKKNISLLFFSLHSFSCPSLIFFLPPLFFPHIVSTYIWVYKYLLEIRSILLINIFLSAL